MNTNPTASVLFVLAFGRAIPSSASVVSLRAIDDFVGTEVAARLSGWSVSYGSGGWVDASTGARVVEPSWRLETIASAAEAAEARAAVRAIAKAYARAFRQDSVMVTETVLASVDFIGAAE